MSRQAPNINSVTSVAGLDPKFVWVISKFWLLIRYIFSFLFHLGKYILLNLRGQKPPSIFSGLIKSKTTALPTETKAKARHGNVLPVVDDRSFLSYGGIRWVSELTPKTYKKQNKEAFPQAEIVEASYLKDKEIKKFEVAVFGDLYEEELENIQASLNKIVKDYKIDSLGLKEIHIVPDLGKYLNKDGIPDSQVLGFTIDENSSMLIQERASLDKNCCYKILNFAINDQQNYQNCTKKARETLWNISKSIEERLRSSVEYSAPDSRLKYGRLRGRFVIDQDTKVIGGVHLGLPAREAITIDQHDELLNNLYAKLLSELRRSKEALGNSLEERILRLVCEYAQRALPRTTPEALKSIRNLNRTTSDQDMPLELFLKYETGESEHQALLVAYLLERLNSEHDHYLRGSFSIDRNWVPGGSHTWVRYYLSEEEVYIIDPMRKYVARLDDYSQARWPYERASDLLKKRQLRPIHSIR